MYIIIMIIIIIDSACLLRALEDSPWVFFGMGFSMGESGHFSMTPPMVSPMMLMPRNSPGFSGDCVCPETLPD